MFIESSKIDFSMAVCRPTSFSIAENCVAAIERAVSTFVLLAAVICSGVTYMVNSFNVDKFGAAERGGFCAVLCVATIQILGALLQCVKFFF